MLSEIIVESGIVGGPSFDWALFGGFVAVTFCAVVIVASVNGITNTLDWIIARYGRLLRADIIGAVLIGVFVYGMVLNNTARATNGEKPTPPPVITVKDIEVKSFKCDHTGLELSWAYGTNVVFGTDKFIIQRRERQIPARTGWGAWYDFDETMGTNYVNSAPFHAEDNQFKVIVRKEAAQ